MTENLYGELTYFIGNQAYVQNIDSTFTSLNATDTTHHFLYTSTGRILSISDNLQIDAQHDITEIYVNYLSTLGLNFLVKGSSTIVTNQQGEAIAIFDAPSNAVLSGTTLRYAQDNSLIEIDLSNLFKP